MTEARVKELEDSRCRVPRSSIFRKWQGDTIKFGATVTIVDEDTDEEIRYQLVGDFESDASNGRDLRQLPRCTFLDGQGSRR